MNLLTSGSLFKRHPPQLCKTEEKKIKVIDFKKKHFVKLFSNTEILRQFKCEIPPLQLCTLLCLPLLLKCHGLLYPKTVWSARQTYRDLCSHNVCCALCFLTTCHTPVTFCEFIGFGNRLKSETFVLRIKFFLKIKKIKTKNQ